MTDLEFIQLTQQGDDDDKHYVVQNKEEERRLIRAFKDLFENNWQVYAQRIKMGGMTA